MLLITLMAVVRLLGVCSSGLVNAADADLQRDEPPSAETVEAQSVQAGLFDVPEVVGEVSTAAPQATAKHERWRSALLAADKMRDKFGDSAIGLAGGMKGAFREKTHENPVELRKKT